MLPSQQIRTTSTATASRPKPPPIRPRVRRTGLHALLFRLGRIWRNISNRPWRAASIVASVAVGVAIAITIIAASEGIDTQVNALLKAQESVDLMAFGINVPSIQNVLAQARDLLTKLASIFTAAIVGLVTWVSTSQRRREISINRQQGQYRAEVLTELVGESFLLCVVGGIVGIPFGQLLCRLVSEQLPELPMVPSVGGVFAIFPTTTLLTFSVTVVIAIVYAQFTNDEPTL